MSDQQYQQQTLKPKAKKTTGFAQYSLIYQLYKATLVNAIKVPTPVQRKTIPVLLQGKDSIVCYKTGSGKTLAYLLPMINRLKTHSKIVGARGLIIIPTKDLAEQITRVLKQFIRFTDLRYTLLLGGHTFEGQFQSLAGNPDIIIATPGRLMQLLMQAEQKMLGRVQMIVFDQADNLFEGGFENQLKQIIKRCPISQRVMVSATINDKLSQFASSCLREYSYIHQEVTLPETMSVKFLIMRTEQKLPALLYMLKNELKSGKTIVFASTRYHVEYLLATVGEFYQCYGIYGKLDMDQRSQALEKFNRKRKQSILIVTDVAARGLDIPSVQHVLHYDYPTNHKTFVHRSGRTARKGLVGSTTAFVTYQQMPYMVEIASYVGRSLSNTEKDNNISYGTFPAGVLDSLSDIVKKLDQQNQEIKALHQTSIRAFDKFKRCRTEASQNSLKKARSMQVQVIYQYNQDNLEDEQKQFFKKLHNFTPKKSFLELQKINMDIQPQNDAFLSAVQRIRKDQNHRKQLQMKKQKLRQRNSRQYQQILTKGEIKQLQRYKEQVSSRKMPIQLVNGVEIQMVGENEKKSLKKDFRNKSQYISSVKDPNIRTQFDDLPKIKNSQIDNMIKDQNPRKKNGKRAWDKTKKDFVYKRDKQDRLSKDQKGKKAYQKWKKQSKLAIPRVGQVQNENQVQQAKQRWTKRRKARHGWKQTMDKGPKGGRLKNNKTKAIQRKMKTKLIRKSMKNKKGKPMK